MANIPIHSVALLAVVIPVDRDLKHPVGDPRQWGGPTYCCVRMSPYGKKIDLVNDRIVDSLLKIGRFSQTKGESYIRVERVMVG